MQAHVHGEGLPHDALPSWGSAFNRRAASRLLAVYFLVCKMYSDTATARETHQRYVTQSEGKDSIFTTLKLRSSKQGAYTDAGAVARVQASMPALSFPTPSSPGSSAADASSPVATEKDAVPPSPRRPQQSVLLAASGDQAPLVSGAARQHSCPTASTMDSSSPALSTLGYDGAAGLWQFSDPCGGSANRRTGALFQNAAAASTCSAWFYTILHREWKLENHHRQFEKPCGAFVYELSDAM